MGTMLLTAILMGLAAAFIELRTSFSIPFVRKLIEQFSVLGIAFSIALSMFFGFVFGATGVTVMLIAIVSMTITQPVYMVASKLQSVGKDVSDVVNDVRRITAPFASLLKFGAKLIIAPFWILWKIAALITRTNTEPAKA